MRLTSKKISAVRRKVLSFYRRYGRSLWFRSTADPYRITVSEIMLQQTPVERVADKYRAWVARWPDWPSLARATSRDVLRMWSGLGYNRRALYLKRLARTVVEEFAGRLPDDRRLLLRLPGIGPYTANAILVFAFGRRIAAVDTNVRKVIVHEFNLPASTSPAEIEAIATRLLPRRNVREWHHALMDYARLALRTVSVRLPPRSRQGRFEGSRRQLRGGVMRLLTTRSRVSILTVARVSGRSVTDVVQAAEALERDGLVAVSRNWIRLV